jgi:hypothetical protein
VESSNIRTLAFEPNRGQSDKQVRFIGRAPNYTAFFTANEVLLTPHPQGDVVRMKLAAANPSPVITPQGVLPGEISYVPASGATPALSHIPTYNTVRYSDVYPGIDVIYYGNQGQLEYDFVVRPGADPKRIRLAFEGAKSIAIDADGALRMQGATGEIRQSRPYVYQETERGRQKIAAQWVRVGAHRFGVHVGAYDRTRPLIIDPLVLYASYLGGSSNDGANGIALDRSGNAYIAGVTTSPDFPGPRNSASTAAFVSKLDPNGRLLYTTYLLETDERGATGIAVDTAGNAYVTGRTSMWRESAWNDVFVAKLDATGSNAAPSGYFFTFGGAEIDWGNRIAVDAAGNAYLVGMTSGNFPTTAGAAQSAPGGEKDAFVAKVNSAGTGLVYATLLGGSGSDSATGVVVDDAGNAYVTGNTQSIDFPVTANAYQREHRGCYTSSGFTMCASTTFVAKLSPDGAALGYSTYLGGTGIDQASAAAGIAIDPTGHAYVTGSTTASNFPTTTGVVQPEAGERLCFYEVCTDVFVAKLNASGSALVYSTYVFGEAQDDAAAIAVDQGGNAYVVGSSVSRYLPLVDAFQPQAPASRNGFVVKLNGDATKLLYASYLGAAAGPGSSNGSSGVSGVAIDPFGNAWVAGQTSATDLPVTAGAMQANWGGCSDTIYGCTDGFVVKIAAAGPGVTTPVTVRMMSAKPAAGTTIEVAWRGIAAPSAHDRITLNQLGRSDEQFEVYGGWSTTGAAAGTLSLALPAGLKSGWYEIRLWSGDWSVFTPLARSAPFELGSILDLPGGGGGGGSGNDGVSSVAPSSGGGGSVSTVVLIALLLVAWFSRGIPFPVPQSQVNRNLR